jgi:hypothetical protein
MTKPDDILVTDFFGGVSRVEVMSSDLEIPIMGRKVGVWEETRREPQGIGNTSHAEMSYSEGGVEGVVGGWNNPLRVDERLAEMVRGILVVLLLGGVVVLPLLRSKETRHIKTE